MEVAGGGVVCVGARGGGLSWCKWLWFFVVIVVVLVVCDDGGDWW